MGNRVYLSGPHKDKDPLKPDSIDWKSYAAGLLFQSGIIVSNPIDLDIAGFMDLHDTEASSSTVKESLNLIDKSDSILANLTGKPESTTMEIFYAHRLGKQVIVFGQEPFSPWIQTHSEARFHKLKEAMEYLVSTSSKFDMIAWSSQFEKILINNSEQFPMTGKSDFEYYSGTLPVLVIAPHSTAYFSNQNLENGESYTGSISALLNKLTGCHSLISSYCLPVDPVSYLNSPIVKFTTDIIKKAEIKLVIFLHGFDSWNIPYDVNINSWQNKSLNGREEYVHLLTYLLKTKNIKDVGNNIQITHSSDQKSIYELIFEDLKTPMIKVDIHKRFRLPKMHPDLYTNLTTALAQYLMLI